MGKIETIANKTNKSISTVSRVLNNDPTFSVSEETRQLIIQVAREMQYTPKGRKTKEKLIGIIYGGSGKEKMNDPYHILIKKEIVELCFEENIKIITIIKNEHKRHDIPKLDGIIAIGHFSDKDVQWMEKYTVHIIFIDSSYQTKKYDTVEFDFYDGVNKLLNYLFKLGHKKIGFIGGNNQVKGKPIVELREEAYKDITKKNNIYNPSHIVISDFTIEDAYSKTNELLNNSPDLTAIFVVDDNLTMGTMRALTEREISVPRDLSIVGFSDFEIAAYCIPSITTININIQLLIKTVISLLKERFQGRITSKKVFVPVLLVVRESCKRAL